LSTYPARETISTPLKVLPSCVKSTSKSHQQSIILLIHISYNENKKYSVNILTSYT